MFDRLKKLFGQAQSNETVAQVTTQVQQGVDAVQATAQNIVEQAKDIHAEVMADGKIDMNDLGTVKDAAQNLAGSVNTIADNVVTNAKEIVADVKEAHAEVMADGKVDMNDLGTVKDAATQVATNVQEMVQKPTV
jgi:cell division septum initiation protein DivIVA